MPFDLNLEQLFSSDDFGDLDLINIPTQQLVFPRDSRHADPVSEDQFKARLDSRIPAKTKKATKLS